MAFWILFSIVMAVLIFKMGQSYERSKPEITYKFSCLQRNCNFTLETSGMEQTMKLANEHAKIHLE